MSATQSNAVELFNEYKETEEYETYLEGLQRDFPEIFLSQLELSIYTWWNETIYRTYCEEKGIEWTSLLEEAENVIVEPAKGGETKAVESYTQSEWDEKFAHLKPIPGQVPLIKEEDTTFKLPTLEQIEELEILPTLV